MTLPRWLISFLLLLPCWLTAQTPPQETNLSDDRIILELSRRMQWDLFWNGYTHANYAESKTIPVTLMESSTEVAVFFAELGEYLIFDFDGRVTGGRGFPPTTNEAAVNEYLRTYGDAPGFGSFVNNPEGSDAGQARRDPRTIDEKRATMEERSLAFVLPKLEPPEYILSSQAPPGLPQFESAVRAQARDWYEAACGPGQLSIPYFSPDDPVVYVYADLGACGTGIFDFHLLSNGQWQLGKLWPHAGPGSPPGSPNSPSSLSSNDWSYTIQQILKYRLLTIPIP